MAETTPVRWMPQTLKARLSILVMTMLLGGLWAFTLVVNKHQEQRLQALLAAQQFSAVGYVAEDIDNKIKLRLDGLAMIANRFPVDALKSENQTRAYLIDRRAIYNLFDGGLMVIKPDGSGAIADYPPLPGRLTNRYDQMSPYREVVASGKPAVGAPRIGRAVGRPVVVFAAPILAADGRLAGVLAGVTGINSPNFLDLVAKPRPGTRGDYLVVAPQHGMFVTGTDASYTLKSLPPAGANRMLDRYLAGDEGSGVAKSSVGIEELSSARRIPAAGWFAVARLPTAEAFAPIRESRQLIFGGAAALSVLVGLATLLALRRALQPLGAAANEIQAMTRGDAPLHSLPVPGHCEVGILVESFNRLQEQVARKEAGLRLMANVFTHSHDGMMVADADATIIDVNPAFSAFTGYSREEAIGQNPRFLKSGRHEADYYRAMWASLRLDGMWQGEIWNRKKDGSLIAEMLTISAVPGDKEGELKYVGIFTDITRLKKTQDDLERMAHYDALTCLPNRALLRDRLIQAVAHAKRRKGLLGVCFIDLDNFKPINDGYGHKAGDQLLVEVARRLQETVRGEDTVARLGGDEFVVLFTRINDIIEMEAALQRLVAAIVPPYEWEGHTLRISASVGVTIYPHDGADPETLLRHADLAMYAAKQAGRDRYCFFDAGQDQQVREQFQRQARLRLALEQGELVLHYQPKVHMRSGQVTGVEALIRWQHPQEGLMAPGQFLPFAEESDLIVDIGTWTLHEALRQVRAWRQEGLHMPVGVNIAARHLKRPDFVASIAALQAEYPDLPAGSLELEIVETSALEDMDKARQAIEGCAGLGVHFALDDFGTGYSSLVYLRSLPVKCLKIDGSFVRDMGTDPHDLAIVEGVVGMGTAFERTVIAECVETDEQGLLLLQLGCEIAQGYGIARPMPGAAIVPWVHAYQPCPAWQSDESAHWRREDFSLLAAEVDHRYWVERVVTAIKGDRSAVLPPLGERDCRFGRWYHGEGFERYGHLAGFRTLDALHVAIHATANEALRLAAAGNRNEAQRLAHVLEVSRDAMVAALRELRRSIIAARRFIHEASIDTKGRAIGVQFAPPH